MATLIEHRRGSRNVYHFNFIDDQEQEVDPVGVTGELRVCVSDSCTILPIGAEMDVDLQPITAPPGEYIGSLYLDWGDGLVFEDDLIIRVSEGC